MSETFRNDLMLLFLEKKVTGVKPRPVASAKLIDRAAIGRVVGFGTTNLAGTRGDGTKRWTDVPVAGDGCWPVLPRAVPGCPRPCARMAAVTCVSIAMPTGSMR
jgi:hypothetical protein